MQVKVNDARKNAADARSPQPAVSFWCCNSERTLCPCNGVPCTGEESITLHNVVKEIIFNKQLMAKVFTEISPALGHVHSREIVRNDLKSNNVIIQREGKHYYPIIIYFRKSQEIVKLKAYKRSADYLALEVREGKKQSPASNIFPFGRMLQSSVSSRSFSPLFTELICIATSHHAQERRSANHIVQPL